MFILEIHRIEEEEVDGASAVKLLSLLLSSLSIRMIMEILGID